MCQMKKWHPLMSQAIAYLFPSWYEGFGIPNLEAMAAGTTLIASDIPAHREVVGDALRPLDKLGAQGLAAGLRPSRGA